jgi:hypothetical protein
MEIGKSAVQTCRFMKKRVQKSRATVPLTFWIAISGSTNKMKKPELKSHVTVLLIQECMQNVLPGQKIYYP